MKRYRVVAVLMAVGLLAAACSRTDDTTTPAGGGTAATTSAANAKCEGVTLEATDTGVTADTITIQVMADTGSPLAPGLFQGNVDALEGFEKFVNANGGGYMGQAGAVKLGLARALMSYDPTLEPILREHEMLSRDPRKVERKKYGQSGARRRFQFSKR